MRALFFDHSQVFGGAEQSLLSLIPRLAAGIESVLVVTRQSALVSEAAGIGILSTEVAYDRSLLALGRDRLWMAALSPARYGAFVALADELAGIALSRQADVIYANTLKASLVAGLAGRKAGKKVVWHIRDIPQGMGAALLFAAGLVFQPKVIAVSTAAARQRALNWPGAAPEVCYNGIDIDAWIAQSQAGRENAVRESLGLSPEVLLLGSFGQLTAWKGQEHAIRCLAQLKKQGANAKLLLVGDAIFENRGYPQVLKGMVHRLGLEAEVVFAGWIKNPAPYMAAIDILVHTPVRPEPFGRVLIEAMALGKPVVAFGSGAVPEIVEDGRTGIVTGRDGLVAAIGRLAADPGLRRAMGAEGQAACRGRFALRQTADKISKMLLELAP